MSDAKKDDLRVGFNSRLKLNFCSSKVTSDAELLAYRELDEALELTEIDMDVLVDVHLGTNKQRLIAPLLRQSIDSRPADFEDLKDVERFEVNPTECHVVGGWAAPVGKEAALEIDSRHGQLR